MKHLILSVGHDSKRQGASSSGKTEWECARPMVDKIKQYVNSIDNQITVHVINTTLKSTVSVVNRIVTKYGKDNCIAIELHFNAAANTTVIGQETLYYPFSGASKALGRKFNNILFERAGWLTKKNRGAKAGWYQGIKNGDILYFLKKTSCRSLIIEPVFLSQLVKMTKGEKTSLEYHIARTLSILF